MKKQPLVSVIVPVYNVERYLDRCLESIVKQTYGYIELILVDDGSTDSSGQICDEWAKKDSRIQVIHKNNAGLGLARNTGMKKSAGEFLVFVDSDDYIDKSMIQRLYDALIGYKAQVVYCSYNRVKDSGKIQAMHQAKEVTSGKQALLGIIGSNKESAMDFDRRMSVWGAIYSNKIIANSGIAFVSEREYPSEDLIFDIKLLPMCNKVVFLNYCGYNYCQNEHSLTQKYIKERYILEKKMNQKVIEEISQIYDIYEYRDRINRFFLGRVRSCIAQEAISGKKYVDSIRDIKSILEDKYLISTLNQYNNQTSVIRQRIFNWLMKNQASTILYFISKVSRII